MGTFTVALQVGDLAGQHFIDVEALVDTGSTYTVLPKDMLDQLGIEREGQRRFELGDDRIVDKSDRLFPDETGRRRDHCFSGVRARRH